MRLASTFGRSQSLVQQSLLPAVDLRTVRTATFTAYEGVHPDLASVRPLVSLERSVGARQGVDKDLWENGSFDCEVYPDLPIDTTWGEVFRRLASWYDLPICRSACPALGLAHV